MPRSADYVINSVSELRYLLQYAIELKWDLTGTTINFVYNIPDMPFDLSYKQALRALESNGFSIKNQVVYYGSGKGSVYKIAFR